MSSMAIRLLGVLLMCWQAACMGCSLGSCLAECTLDWGSGVRGLQFSKCNLLLAFFPAFSRAFEVCPGFKLHTRLLWVGFELHGVG